MEGVYLLYYELMKKKESISKEIKTLKGQLSNFPAGNLICVKNGKYINHRVSNAGTYKYIRKGEEKLISSLAEKKYILAQLKDLENEKDIIDLCLDKYSSKPSIADKLINDPVYGDIILKNIKPLSQGLYEWSKAEYKQSVIHPETLQYQTLSGHIVRSKSEVMIANALFINRIPFRYECELVLNEIYMYPDFTIRHPITGEYKYWEHFGLMDSTNYVNTFSYKINIYCQNNIIPSINLITTFETKKHPLTPSVIEKTIQQYFL